MWCVSVADDISSADMLCVSHSRSHYHIPPGHQALTLVASVNVPLDSQLLTVQINSLVRIPQSVKVIVWHVALSTHFLDNFGNSWQVNPGHRWEQVVFNLIVHASNQKGEHLVAVRKVGRVHDLLISPVLLLLEAHNISVVTRSNDNVVGDSNSSPEAARNRQSLEESQAHDWVHKVEEQREGLNAASGDGLKERASRFVSDEWHSENLSNLNCTSVGESLSDSLIWKQQVQQV
mmetsp:Transcript_9959/g.37151  ORF Transcript_9959/g.37151 Transcript_9959/m.37151 type:complete len:234 (-) Transcript_9959:902-1603(-)